MGYTHHWYTNAEASNELFNAKYKELLPVAHKIVSLALDEGIELEVIVSSEEIAVNGTENEKYGYFCWGPGKEVGFCFNGTGRFPGEYAYYSFCKTGKYNYDFVVVAMLCAIDHIYGKDLVKVDSDGGMVDQNWEAGKDLFERALEEVEAEQTEYAKNHCLFQLP